MVSSRRLEALTDAHAAAADRVAERAHALTRLVLGQGDDFVDDEPGAAGIRQ